MKLMKIFRGNRAKPGVVDNGFFHYKGPVLNKQNRTGNLVLLRPYTPPVTDYRGNGGVQVLGSIGGPFPALYIPQNSLVLNSITGSGNTPFQGTSINKLNDPSVAVDGGDPKASYIASPRPDQSQL